MNISPLLTTQYLTNRQYIIKAAAADLPHPVKVDTADRTLNQYGLKLTDLTPVEKIDLYI